MLFIYVYNASLSNTQVIIIFISSIPQIYHLITECPLFELMRLFIVLLHALKLHCIIPYHLIVLTATVIFQYKIANTVNHPLEIHIVCILVNVVILLFQTINVPCMHQLAFDPYDLPWRAIYAPVFEPLTLL